MVLQYQEGAVMGMQLSAEIAQRLEALAHETGRSVAALTREALLQRIDALEDFYRDGAAARYPRAESCGAKPGLDLGL
jgi:predicted DNA-binding protein